MYVKAREALDKNILALNSKLQKEDGLEVSEKKKGKSEASGGAPPVTQPASDGRQLARLGWARPGRGQRSARSRSARSHALPVGRQHLWHVQYFGAGAAGARV